MHEIRKIVLTVAASITMSNAAIGAPSTLSPPPSPRAALFAYSGRQQVTIKATTAVSGGTKYSFAYLGAHDTPIDAYAYVPTAASKDHPAPCLVLIHGLGATKETVEPVAVVAASLGYASVMIDQAGQGERSAPGPKIPKFTSEADLTTTLRTNSLTTVVDLRRLMDAATQVPGIDSSRFGVVGYSLGALVGAVVSSVDKRALVTVLMAGGGDIAKILREEAASSQPLGVYFKDMILATDESTLRSQLRDIDPIFYVAGISPRPLLMLNGRLDRIIPPDRALALYNAAGQSKQIVWYDKADHFLPWLPVYTEMSRFLAKNLPVGAVEAKDPKP